MTKRPKPRAWKMCNEQSKTFGARCMLRKGHHGMHESTIKCRWSRVLVTELRRKP